MTETDWTGACTHEVETVDYSRVAQGKDYFDDLLDAVRDD